MYTALYAIMKPFKTYDEQIELLQNRGLLPNISEVTVFHIKNRPGKVLLPVNPLNIRKLNFSKPQATKYAKELLQTYGYYNIVNQYNKPFLQSDGSYQADIDFFMLFSLHQIDTKMENIIFYPILQVEQRLKTCIAYEFAKSYGPFEGDIIKNYIEPYFQPANYNQHLKTKKGVPKYTLLIKKLKDIYADAEYKPFQHYKTHHSHIPILVFINKLTYGELFHFYEVLKIQPNIAANFKLNPSQLRTIMLFLNQVRNDCAHFSGFYNQRYPYIKKEVPLLSAFQSKFSFQSQREVPNMFLLLIIFKYLLPKSNFDLLSKTVKREIFDFISEKYIPKISEHMKDKLAIPSKKDCDDKFSFLEHYKI